MKPDEDKSASAKPKIQKPKAKSQKPKAKSQGLKANCQLPIAIYGSTPLRPISL
jgi:hypothetical protein